MTGCAGVDVVVVIISISWVRLRCVLCVVVGKTPWK